MIRNESNGVGESVCPETKLMVAQLPNFMVALSWISINGRVLADSQAFTVLNPFWFL